MAEGSNFASVMLREGAVRCAAIGNVEEALICDWNPEGGFGAGTKWGGSIARPGFCVFESNISHINNSAREKATARYAFNCVPTQHGPRSTCDRRLFSTQVRSEEEEHYSVKLNNPGEKNHDQHPTLVELEINARTKFACELSDIS